MAVFLDPTGRATYGIGICDRCKRKFYLDQLMPDPNSPGLKVCVDDLDDYDPYRLPARQTERINLPFVRPDQSVALQPDRVDHAGVSWILTEGGGSLVTEGGAHIITEA